MIRLRRFLMVSLWLASCCSCSAALGGILFEQGKYLHTLFPADPIKNEMQARRIGALPLPILPTKLVMAPNMAIANDDYLMAVPTTVCSGYDASVCHPVGQFYQSNRVPILASALVFLDRDEILQLAFNSGFNSAKLKVTPSIMLGAGRRFYLNESHTSQIVLHGYRWFGSRVTHRPCLDSFNREYFCGSLTAWSDFTWDSHPQSYAAYLVFNKLF